jgi:hypothetical protein
MMGMMFLILILAVTIIMLLTGGDISSFSKQASKFISTIYPKFGASHSSESIVNPPT